jgi:hypothetical protein
MYVEHIFKYVYILLLCQGADYLSGKVSSVLPGEYLACDRLWPVSSDNFMLTIADDSLIVSNYYL